MVNETKASGIAAGQPVRFSRDENGLPWLELPGVERAGWTVGPDR